MNYTIPSGSNAVGEVEPGFDKNNKCHYPAAFVAHEK